MKKTAITGAIGVIALSLALVGCGSPNKPTATSSKTATAQVTPPSPIQNPGPNPTIASYIRQNGIQETPVDRGDPGSPTVNMPTPPGWQSAGKDTPDWAYDAIFYNGPGAGQYTPTIAAVMSKLTGNVDPQKIIALAPGELNNLPGYQATSPGAAGTLGGFPAFQLAGTWSDYGQTKVVAQQTVVIPGNGAVYVLQLNSDGQADQADVVSAATKVVDQQTTITR
jgi:hypothetical protein